MDTNKKRKRGREKEKYKIKLKEITNKIETKFDLEDFIEDVRKHGDYALVPMGWRVSLELAKKVIEARDNK